MNLCKDCFYVDITGDFSSLWKCQKIYYSNPVSGEIISSRCEVERSSLSSSCGPEGKLFVNKKEREDEINIGEPRSGNEPNTAIPADRCQWEVDYDAADEAAVELAADGQENHGDVL